jgi:predicted Zn-dependent protease
METYRTAYQCFSENARKYPTPLNYLFAYRTAVLLDPKEETAIQLIKESLDKNPGNSALQLCLASSYYRTFRTKEANGVLNTIDPAFKESVRTYDIAGTSSKNLPAFDEELRNALNINYWRGQRQTKARWGIITMKKVQEPIGTFCTILSISLIVISMDGEIWRT